jgi:hypothetical protein
MPWFDSGQGIGCVSLRAAPAVHDVAALIECEHRRRREAAFADAQPRPVAASRLGARRLGHLRGEGKLGAVQVARIVSAVDDPDLILLVDAHADGHPEHPVVRHRLGPERIDFEDRHLAGLGLRLRRLLEGAFGQPSPTRATTKVAPIRKLRFTAPSFRPRPERPEGYAGASITTDSTDFTDFASPRRTRRTRRTRGLGFLSVRLEAGAGTDARTGKRPPSQTGGLRAKSCRRIFAMSWPANPP